MRNLFKPLFICWGIISLLLLILAGGVLAVSYLSTAPPTGGMQVIGGSNLLTSISLNGTDFQFSILSLWLLFSVAALNLAAVILIYFYNSKNKKPNEIPKHAKRKIFLTVLIHVLLTGITLLAVWFIMGTSTIFLIIKDLHLKV